MAECTGEKLSAEEIESQLKKFTGWKYENGSIKKKFTTKSFPATMGFVTAVCGVCQRHNHHPDYILMKFKEAEVSFSTHNVGGVTENDFNVVKDIEEKIPV